MGECIAQGQQVVVHSALLAAHSAYYARKLEEMKHSQNLFPSSKEPVLLDTGGPGTSIQVSSAATCEVCLTHSDAC